MRGTRSNGNGHREPEMPPKKPAEEHKQHLNVTVEPVNRAWLKENWARLGYRSESHAVDDAIRKLRESGVGRSEFPVPS
jgi:hypothetical protein